MDTKTYKNVQRIIASATALVITSVGLNIVVTQTLGSFSAASVLLALYLAFWTFVLGSAVLIALSIWLIMKHMFPARTSAQLESENHESIAMPASAMPARNPSRRQDDQRDLVSPPRAA
jgi:hypothetical protein